MPSHLQYLEVGRLQRSHFENSCQAPQPAEQVLLFEDDERSDSDDSGLEELLGGLDAEPQL